MEINLFDVKGLPVVIIEDFFTSNEEAEIFDELRLFNQNNKMMDPPRTGGAKDEHGNQLKKNKAVFVDEVYNNRDFSPILTHTRKFYDQKYLAELREKHIFFTYFDIVNRDNTLVSYYENSDYYKPHMDVAVFTHLVWFYEQPKRFEGGVLNIENELEIECVNNRYILFPSILHHSVSPVQIDRSYQNKGLGRYTITNFGVMGDHNNG